MKQKPIVAAKVPTEVNKKTTQILKLSSTPLWRLQVIRILQLVGYGALAVGGAEWTGLIAVLPNYVAAWLVTIGPLLVASKPLVEFIGDIMDDGLRNLSFKIPGATALLLLTCCLFFVSCSNGFNLGITLDGCAMATYTDQGRTWLAGPCVGVDGKVNRYRAEWVTNQDVRIRYERISASGRYSIKYQAPDQSWLVWDSKSGVLLGPVPAGIPADQLAKELTAPFPPRSSK